MTVIWPRTVSVDLTAKEIQNLTEMSFSLDKTYEHRNRSASVETGVSILSTFLEELKELHHLTPLYPEQMQNFLLLQDYGEEKVLKRDVVIQWSQHSTQPNMTGDSQQSKLVFKVIVNQMILKFGRLDNYLHHFQPHHHIQSNSSEYCKNIWYLEETAYLMNISWINSTYYRKDIADNENAQQRPHKMIKGLSA